MNKIVLTADSGICAVKREDSVIIPAQIVENGKYHFPDDKRVTNREIIDNMIEKGMTYKTSSPLLGDYERAFSSLLEKGCDVIHLSMSSGISEGSVNSAHVIANILNEEYQNKVYVIDSLTGASGGTLLYELAYDEIFKGSHSPQEIVTKLNELKKRIKTSFYVPNIDGFISSGRDKTNYRLKESILSNTSRLAKMASFKFRVDFHENGDLFLKKVFRATDTNGMEKMVREIVNEKTIENYMSYLVVIGSLYQDKVDLEKVRSYLQSFGYFRSIINNEIGGVVAPYGCHDLSGISLIKKR